MFDSMIRLLKLSDLDGERPEEMPDVRDDEFYDKIVGVKGPKCKKEVERLDGWIKYYFLNNDNGRGEEPLRLAHLLLGKAALLGSDGGNEVGFPSTIDEFLQNDPPPHMLMPRS
ncbi:hypothetical protein OSB04_023065 [Centaurea solstitialis]|uniref:Uncharacterized protein n=1 Tax=Centaurea solstitialis TaxID=347529 RepID=A0AA38SJ61_9ASTR|nr:hypothetical protein OSB04_023065 [Centaurea solstitialis]